MTELMIREATKSDVPEIVTLLATDELGSKRESVFDTDITDYYTAFERIAADPNNFLYVGCIGQAVIGTFQFTIIQNMTYKGGIRAQIEGVRVNARLRGKKVGEQMIKWAINKAASSGAHIVQLTTNKGRPLAIKFYENLGFVSTHEGMKLFL